MKHFHNHYFDVHSSPNLCSSIRHANTHSTLCTRVACPHTSYHGDCPAKWPNFNVRSSPTSHQPISTIGTNLLTHRRVYVKNLEERIKIDELKSALSEIFSEYGDIIDLVAKTNLKAKGQAFIVFDNPESAAKAIEEVNGFELFDKPMHLDFARTRSDATVLQEEGEAGLERWKRGRLAEKERRQAMEANQQQKLLKRPAVAVTGPGGAGGDAAGRPAKTVKGAGLKSSGANAAAVIPDEYLPPNKTLFIRDLPDSYDADGLSRIFSRFEGFKEVRMVPGRKGIAFVEYEAEAGAISAKEATAGMQLGDEGKGIRVTYQRA